MRLGLGLGLRGRVRRILGLRRPWEFRVPLEVVDAAVERAGAKPWFSYAYKNRREYWNVWQPSVWLAQRLPRSARVLETACGSATNLVWLGERGFRGLSGFDLDSRNIAAASEIGTAAGVYLVLWQDDGLAPRRLGGRYDVILAFNWIYVAVCDAFDLTD